MAKKIKDPVFRAYCVSSMDLDGDRKLSLSEADSVKSIDVSGLEIKSLAGLEYFRNLKSLDFSGTRVESFAFQLPALEMFKCANNENLAALDLTGCPSLSFVYASHTGVKSVALGTQTGLYKHPGPGVGYHSLPETEQRQCAVLPEPEGADLLPGGEPEYPLSREGRRPCRKIVV